MDCEYDYYLWFPGVLKTGSSITQPFWSGCVLLMKLGYFPHEDSPVEYFWTVHPVVCNRCHYLSDIISLQASDSATPCEHKSMFRIVQFNEKQWFVFINSISIMKNKGYLCHDTFVLVLPRHKQAVRSEGCHGTCKIQHRLWRGG